MPASTPWWSTPSIAAPRPGRRPTLGLAAAIVASVLSGAAMADPPPLKDQLREQSPYPGAAGASESNYIWLNVVQPPRVTPSLPYAVYPMPHGIDRGTCDRRSLIKEVSRGPVVASSSGTKARPVIVGGDPVSILVGSVIGRSMDDLDQYCVSRVLEFAPDRARINWYGDLGIAYGVTPLNTFERDGRYCREFYTAAQIDGRSERAYAVACRMVNGMWQVMS
jgi:surface antigen